MLRGAGIGRQRTAVSEFAMREHAETVLRLAVNGEARICE